MSSNSFDFSNLQTQVSSLYALASTYVESGFEIVQKVLPELKAVDAKTMLFGAAFFAALCKNWALTGASTLVGAFFWQNISDLGNKGIELFNAQSSQAKYAIVAGVVLTLAFVRIAGYLTNEFLKGTAVAAVGLYTGFVLGKPSVS